MSGSLRTPTAVTKTSEPRSLRDRLVAAGLLAPAALLLWAVPAHAQDELPTGPPDGNEEADETEDEPSGPVIDFGFEVSEEGTVITDREDSDAESEPVEDSDDGGEAEGGIVGTGSVEPPTTGGVEETPAVGAAEAESARTRGIQEELPESTGPSSAMWLVVIGLLILGAGLGYLFMRRNDEIDEEAEAPGFVETPLRPDGQPTMGGQPAYAGAADAGAYKEGGAAYAQYADPSLSTAAMGTGQTTEKRSFKDQVVDFAEKGLVESGRDKLIARKLQQAGKKMRPGEWLMFALGGTLIAFVVGTIVFNWFLGILIAGGVVFGFWTMLDRGAQKRRNAFAEALPETLGLLAGSLRAGMSMLQAVQTVADEADEPTSDEFQRVVTEVRLGRELAHSFKDMSDRMDSEDFAWVVTAVEIHNEVGGDLSVILDRVGGTIRARNRVRGQVQALSAEGRMSGLILFLLPPAMVLLISVSNRNYLDEMISTGAGKILLAFAVFLLLVGGAWLKRLARFVY